MPAQIISGTEIAKQIREELKEEIAGLKEQHNLVPGLATVLVGEDPASQVYVGQKEKTSKALGLYSERHDLPADTGEEELLALVDKLNKNFFQLCHIFLGFGETGQQIIGSEIPGGHSFIE